MFEFIQQGGTVMYILLAASVLALTIIFERSWSLRRSVVIPLKDIQAIEAAVRSNDVERALELCRANNTAMSRILWTALANRGVRRSVMKEILEETGRQEVAHLDRFIGVLGVIAAIAPLLGLLGTVIGMIQVFAVITTQGVGDPGVLAGGISQALITTAAGLTVAIPSLFFYRFFRGRVDELVITMEQEALKMMEALESLEARRRREGQA